MFDERAVQNRFRSWVTDYRRESDKKADDKCASLLYIADET